MMLDGYEALGDPDGDHILGRAEKAAQRNAEQIRAAVQRMHFHEIVVGEGASRFLSHCHGSDDGGVDHLHAGEQVFPGRSDGGYWRELGPSLGSDTPVPVAANARRALELLVRRRPADHELMRGGFVCSVAASSSARRTGATRAQQ